MDALLVLISLSFHYAYAAAQDHHRRFVKRQEQPTQTLSSTTIPPLEHSLPASIRTRIPIPSPPSPSGGVQTTVPEHPDSNPDKGPIIGFSIGIVVLVLLFIAAGWMLFRRYKQWKQRQAASQNVVQLQPTSHHPPSITKNSFDDTQSSASHK